MDIFLLKSIYQVSFGGIGTILVLSTYVIGSFIMAVFFILYGCIWFFKPLDDANSLKQEVFELHQKAAKIRPSSQEIQECLLVLKKMPSLVNHPMSPFSFTPFLRACWSGNAVLVRYMLKHGADIHSCTVSKESPIYLAAYRATKRSHWDPTVLDMLYNAGCDLSVLNAKGHSALHLAAHAGHEPLAYWLLSRNAHHSLPVTKISPSPYHIALVKNHKALAALLHVYCPYMVPRPIRECHVVSYRNETDDLKKQINTTFCRTASK